MALFIASGPIMRVLFERGAFTTIDAQATAGMLSALAIGLPAYVLDQVLQPSFFAREDTKTPMIYAGIAHCCQCGAGYWCCSSVSAPWASPSPPVSTGWVNVALLARELRRRAEFALDDAFRRAFIGMVLACLVMGALVWWLTGALGPFFAPERGLLVQVPALAALIGGGLLTYLVAGTLFGALSPKRLLRDLLGR